MDYFKQNIEGLKEFRDNIYSKLNCTEVTNTDNRVTCLYKETAVNGEPVMIIENENKLYRLNSSYNPTHEAKIWADQYSLNNLNNVILMFGLGNGLFARELVAKMDKQDFLFIYEPNRQIFDFVLEEFDITDLISNPNIILAVEGLNDFEFHNLLQNAVDITNLSTHTRCFYPYYDILFKESHVKFWKEIKDAMVHTKININTEILFGQRMIANGLKNIKYTKHGNILEDFLKDMNKDLPAIVVAAGPSLGKNLEELKKAKGKAYIFVVDRALDYVLDNGLIPDFVVTLDPIKPVEYFSRRDDVTIPLFCEPVSNYEVLDAHKGRKIFYVSSDFFKKMYKSADRNILQIIPGSSVATAAFSICLRLGFPRIILVGQDLAYDGNMTHAGEIMEEEIGQDIMVEGVDGSQVRSRYDWYEFLVWYQDVLKFFPEIEVIDTKLKGAKIKGTKSMPLKEVIDKFCIQDNGLDNILLQKKSTFDNLEYGKVRKYLNKSLEDLRLMKKKANEAIKLCDIQLGEYKKLRENAEVTSRNYKKISKLNTQIQSKPVYALLDSYVLALTANDLSKIYTFSEDIKSDQIETYEKSKAIYTALIDSVEFAAPLLEEELKHLDME